MTFKMTHFIHGQNEIAKTLPNKRNSAIIFMRIEMNIDKKKHLWIIKKFDQKQYQRNGVNTFVDFNFCKLISKF